MLENDRAGIVRVGNYLESARDGNTGGEKCPERDLFE